MAAIPMRTSLMAYLLHGVQGDIGAGRGSSKGFNLLIDSRSFVALL